MLFGETRTTFFLVQMRDNGVSQSRHWPSSPLLLDLAFHKHDVHFPLHLHERRRDGNLALFVLIHPTQCRLSHSALRCWAYPFGELYLETSPLVFLHALWMQLVDLQYEVSPVSIQVLGRRYFARVRFQSR